MKLRIPLSPVAKARARTVLSGGKVHSYTPEKTKGYEEQVKWLLKAARVDPLLKPTPIKVSFTFWIEQPKKSKYDWPVSKPDLDNLYKSLCDAANGILWEDDSQVTTCVICKRFAPNKGYIELEVEEDA